MATEVRFSAHLISLADDPGIHPVELPGLHGWNAVAKWWFLVSVVNRCSSARVAPHSVSRNHSSLAHGREAFHTPLLLSNQPPKTCHREWVTTAPCLGV